MMVLIEQRPRDCIACKLISGGGLIGAGCYVAYNARNFQKIGKIGMMGFSSGLAFLGTARLLDLPPFHIPLDPQNKNEIR